MDDIVGIENIFPSWKVKRLIGSGSYGKVYELERVEDDAVYRSAMKVISIPQNEGEIRSRLAEGESRESVRNYYDDVTKSLLSENRIMAGLKGNSNIVSYEDHQLIKHEDGIGSDIFIRMELLTSFIDYMAENRITEDTVIRLGIDICKALEICESKSLIHRDIKPGNIFVSETGDFKLGDFGIARTIDKTMGGLSKKGTYRYMAPEVYKGDSYGRSVDICSLGLVMYYLMNGNRTPFLPDAPASVTFTDEENALAKRMNGEPMRAPKDASVGLASIILKACSFEPAARYQSAAQMREDLEALRSGSFRQNGAPGSRPSSVGPAASARQTGPAASARQARPAASADPAASARPAGPAGPTGPAGAARPMRPMRPAAAVRAAAPRAVHSKSKRRKQFLIAGSAAGAAILIGLIVFMLVNGLPGRTGPEPDMTAETTAATEQPKTEATEAAAADDPKEHVYAHRRGEGDARDDNVFSQYDDFINQGAEYIEQDVTLYGGEPVVSYSEAYAAGKVKLRDVFDRYGKNVHYLVEIKTPYDATANAIVDLVKDYGYEELVVIQCFEKDTLKKVKNALPDTGTMFLIDRRHDDGSDLLNALQDQYIDEISVSYEDGYMTENNCKKVHNVDKRFSAWFSATEIDEGVEEARILEAIRIGVDGYFTTMPALALELERDYRDQQQ